MSTVGPVFFPNVLITTQRTTYNATTRATTGVTTHLSQVLAHIEPTGANEYTVLPDGGLVGEYTLNVASGTDIADGDLVSSITLLDGVTPWPNEWASSSSTYWQVTRAREAEPVFLPQRFAYIKRVGGGGAAHI